MADTSELSQPEAQRARVKHRVQQASDNQTYLDFVRHTAQRSIEDRMGGTPRFLVDGEELIFANEDGKLLVDADADSLMKAIEEAAQS